MNQPKITVLVPCYNAGKYFVECIESIINQTYKNLEILLIDDGSTDNTLELITGYAAKDSRIVYLKNEVNMGLIKSLNKGIINATGEFIARMDADDISHIDRITRIYSQFEKEPHLDAVSAGFWYMNVQGKILQAVLPKAILSASLKFVSFFGTPLIHACVIVKTKVLKDNLFDERYIHSEDYELFSRLLFLDYTFKNLKEPLYFIRLNPASVSFKYEKIQISTHTRISKRNIENYFDKTFDFFLHKVMINRISFTVSIDMLKEAFKNLNLLKEEFIAREKVSPEVITEIEEYLIEQKIDILLQSIKQSAMLNKPILIMALLSNIDLFLHPRGRKYFRSKFRSRIKIPD